MPSLYGRCLASTGAHGIKAMFENWDIVEDYDKLLTHLCKTHPLVHQVAKQWQNDAEFGRQMLNGAHPLRIRRISKVPETMKVSHSMIKGSLQRSLTLEEELKVQCLCSWVTGGA